MVRLRTMAAVLAFVVVAAVPGGGPSVVHSAGAADSEEEDALALRALRSAWGNTAPASWSAGGGGRPSCAWTGVMCDDAGHVVELQLADLGLAGALPADVGRLRHLRVLNLTSNLVRQLDGPIPA